MMEVEGMITTVAKLNGAMGTSLNDQIRAQRMINSLMQQERNKNGIS